MNKLISYLIIPFFIFYVACSSGSSQENKATASESSISGHSGSVEQLLKKSMQGVEETKYHEFVDPKNGLVQARYPIPKSWKVNQPDAEIYIEGPHHLKVYHSSVNNYYWSSNPMMQQTIRMNGQQLAQPLSIQQLLDQYVRPNAEAQGYLFKTSYPLPEVAGLRQRLIHAMPNTGTQKQVEALGTEWQTNQGTRSLIVLLRYQSLNQQVLFWNIETTELESDPDYFEEATNAYVYSSANAQFNPQWIQYMNGQLASNIQKSNEFWAQASAQSAAAHQQRMNAIAARGQAAMSTAQTYSDILDISHQGFLNRSSINDAGHAKSIRAINETTLIGNHETGEHYTVPSGSNYYWVSADGYYISTDNALFNPNTDQRMNDKDWTKFASEQ